VDPDLPLIQALQGGDDSALATLISRHQEPLYYFVYRYLRDETSARDVVAETFVRVYFHARKFTPRSAVKTWMHSIALNLCRDHSRRLMRQRHIVSLEAPRGSYSLHPQPVDDAPSPAAEVMNRERMLLLEAAIDALPRKLKEALILFSLEGRSQKEVAELLGITPKTVELRVYHAKQRLRDRLSRGTPG
jgi:RNA polymerase sigma factor (sigma-70 family)